VPGLLCSFYNQAEATAAKAKSLFDQLLDAYYGPRSGGVIPSVNESSRLIIESTLSSTSLIALLQDMTIPADPADLTGYDNTACAVCGGSGGGCSFIAAGTSVDIASSGPYSFFGKSRTIIEWPAGWPANENDNGVINAPTTRYILDDVCLPGLELSFPFDTGPFTIYRYFDDGTGSSINRTSQYVIPSQVVKVAVYRGGAGGTSNHHPFTLRVTRPS
jgi:hypothetical protein